MMSDELIKNKTVAHYQIIKKIGSGGMGEVYLAKDTKLDRKVALKFLPKEYTKDNDAKERFKREAKAAAALNHPNIITIHEINEHEDRTYIAMEHVEGETLKDIICRGGPMCPPPDKNGTTGKHTGLPLHINRILDIAIQICEGLQKAHRAGIIHRDIKPQNILVDKDNKVKILDFGLAKLKGVSQLTKEQSTLGTLHYMSPEQVSGESVDNRSDIWSLGVVLYEMVTGQLPFKGDYQQSVMYSIMNENPESITASREGIPLDLEGIVNNALSKDPDERYQEVNEMVLDLIKLKEDPDHGISEEAKGKSVPSIAVLPFRDMSPQKDQDYFCEGIAEELIDALVKVEGVKVASRTASFQFEGKGHSIQKIGEELKVNTVLEGSVRKAGNRLRVTAQLVNVSDGFHIWSDKYDRDSGDIFIIQDEIALAIVDNLKLKLLKDEKEKLVRRYTYNEEAHDLYLKGRYFWNRRYEIGLQKSIECFQMAIDKDPNYALPYVGIANSFVNIGWYGFLPSKEAFPKARAAVERALEIDDTLGDAYITLGYISFIYDWDWLGAQKAFKHGFELKTSDAIAYIWYGICLSAMKRHEEAILYAKQGHKLDPLTPILTTLLGATFMLAREFDQAIGQMNKALEIDPSSPTTLWYLGTAQLCDEKIEEAIKTLEKAAINAKDTGFVLGCLGLSYGLAGKKDKALKILKRLEKLSKNRYISGLNKAFIYLGFANYNKTFEYLERAYVERDSMLPFMHLLPFFDKLHHDPRWKKLHKNIGVNE